MDRGSLLLVEIGQFHLEQKQLEGAGWDLSLVDEEEEEEEGEVGLSLAVQHRILKAFPSRRQLLC